MEDPKHAQGSAAPAQQSLKFRDMTLVRRPYSS